MAEPITMIRRGDEAVVIVNNDAGMFYGRDEVLTSEGAVVARTDYAGATMGILTGRGNGTDIVITDLPTPSVTCLTALCGIHGVFPAILVKGLFPGTSAIAGETNPLGRPGGVLNAAGRTLEKGA